MRSIVSAGGQGRRAERAIVHEEDVLARAFTEMTRRIQRNAFRETIKGGFHVDELRVHIIRARLGHGRQSVGRDPRPGRNTNVHSLAGIRPQILPPRIVANINFGGRVEGIDAGFAVAPENDGADVARPHAVLFHQLNHAAQDLVAGEGEVDAVNAGRIGEPLHVFHGAKNCGAARQRVTANAFKHRRTVVHNVRHHVQRGVIPGDKLSVVPDLFRFLNRHADSLSYKYS